MAKTFGAQTVDTYPGKRIVKSGAVGATNIGEIKWLVDTLLATSAPWKLRGWAYIVDISKMSPVSPDVSAELVNLHKTLSSAGCKAMAFVDYCSFVTSAQAKSHQQQSHTAIQEGHFNTEEDAIKWAESIIG